MRYRNVFRPLSFDSFIQLLPWVAEYRKQFLGKVFYRVKSEYQMLKALEDLVGQVQDCYLIEKVRQCKNLLELRDQGMVEDDRTSCLLDMATDWLLILALTVNSVAEDIQIASPNIRLELGRNRQLEKFHQAKNSNSNSNLNFSARNALLIKLNLALKDLTITSYMEVWKEAESIVTDTVDSYQAPEAYAAVEYWERPSEEGLEVLNFISVEENFQYLQDSPYKQVTLYHTDEGLHLCHGEMTQIQRFGQVSIGAVRDFWSSLGRIHPTMVSLIKEILEEKEGRSYAIAADLLVELQRLDPLLWEKVISGLFVMAGEEGVLQVNHYRKEIIDLMHRRVLGLDTSTLAVSVHDSFPSMISEFPSGVISLEIPDQPIGDSEVEEARVMEIEQLGQEMFLRGRLEKEPVLEFESLDVVPMVRMSGMAQMDLTGVLATKTNLHLDQALYISLGSEVILAKEKKVKVQGMDQEWYRYSVISHALIPTAISRHPLVVHHKYRVNSLTYINDEPILDVVELLGEQEGHWVKHPVVTRLCPWDTGPWVGMKIYDKRAVGKTWNGIQFIRFAKQEGSAQNARTVRVQAKKLLSELRRKKGART